MPANNSTTPVASSVSMKDNGALKYNYPSIIVIGILIVFENTLVCLAFTFSRKLRKRQANILVCSQAAADLIMGLVFVPWILVEKYTGKNYHSGYIIMYVLFVSLFNLLSLALDRYLALIKPLMHHLVMDVNRTKKMLLGIWIAPFFITILPVSWQYYASKKTAHLTQKVYLYIFWGLMLFLCGSMIFMYIRIYRTAAKTIRLRQKRMNAVGTVRENRIKTTRKELRIAHLFGLLLFFFILAYLPILYINLKALLGLGDTPILRKLSLYCLITNSMVNPILCLLLKKDYQLQIKRWICFEWVTERWSDESPGSQVSCRTGVDDMETTDSGSEGKRKRLAAISRKSKSVPKQNKNDADIKVRFEQDGVAFLPKTVKNHAKNGIGGNGIKTYSPSADIKKKEEIFSKEDDHASMEKLQDAHPENDIGRKDEKSIDADSDNTQTLLPKNTLKQSVDAGLTRCENKTEKDKMAMDDHAKHLNTGDPLENMDSSDNQEFETEDDSQPILQK